MSREPVASWCTPGPLVPHACLRAGEQSAGRREEDQRTSKLNTRSRGGGVGIQASSTRVRSVAGAEGRSRRSRGSNRWVVLRQMAYTHYSSPEHRPQVPQHGRRVAARTACSSARHGLPAGVDTTAPVPPGGGVGGPQHLVLRAHTHTQGCRSVHTRHRMSGQTWARDLGTPQQQRCACAVSIDV
jgi:hypothetical protein